MKHLDGILKLVDSEFESIDKNGKFRSREEIDYVYKLIDIAKDIYCIWKYEEEMGDDYSERNRPYRYETARPRNTRERYPRNYSMTNSEYIDELHELMRNAPDENTRQSIQRMIQQLE